MRATVVRALQHPTERIRVLAANLVATVVRRGTLQSWKELLPGLVKQISTSKEAPAVLGAALGLRLVVEDETPSVVNFPEFERMVLPVVLRFTSHPSEFIRSDMVQCVRHFAKARMPLQKHLPEAMKSIMPLAKDKSHRVRRQVCRTVRQVVDTMINPLYPQMPKVVDYFLLACADPDDSVAAEAFEVWPSLTNKIRYELSGDPAAGALGAGESRATALLSLITSKFPVLMPQLLRRLALTDDVVEERGIPRDDDPPDAGEPDREQDVRIEHRRSHYGTAKLAPSAKAAAGDASAPGHLPEFGGADTAPASNGAVSVAEAEDAGRVDSGGTGEVGAYFRGRDAALEALSWLAEVAEGAVVASCMPLVTQLAKASGPANSRKREAAMLCISGIAARNPNAFERYVGGLEPVLLQGLGDPSPCVRGAACSACAEIMQILGAHRATLDKMMRVITGLAGDGFKYVQHEALRCLLVCFDRLAGDAAHLHPPVATAVAKLMRRLQVISKRRALDVLTAILHTAGDDAARQPWVPPVAAVVIDTWKGVPAGGCDHEHPLLVPVLEAYVGLCNVMGGGMAPLRPDITFPRLVRIAQQVMALSREAEERRAVGPNVDALVIAVDTMEAILAAAGPRADSLLVASDTLVATLSEALQDRNTDLLDAVARAVGTIASAAPKHLRSNLPAVCMRLTRMVTTEHVTMCQNACWALGEMAAAFRADMAAGVEPIRDRLVRLLQKQAKDGKSPVDRILFPQERKAVQLNIGCLLGRLGLAHAPRLVPAMPHIGEAWCICLLGMSHDEDTAETLQSLEGFRNTLVACGPAAVRLRKVAVYVAAFLSKVGATPRIVEQCQAIIDVFKRGDPAGWAEYVRKMPTEIPRVFRVMSESKSLNLR